MQLSADIAALGWSIFGEQRIGDLETTTLRNPKLTAAEDAAAVAQLAKLAYAEKWSLLHHGRTGTILSAVLTRKVQK